VADKLAARSAQKGTVGGIYPQEDMPFNRKGITPDLIINALAFPSRMTIALLIEILSGRVVCSSSPLHRFSIDGRRLLNPDGTMTIDEIDDEIYPNDSTSLGGEFKDMFCGTEHGTSVVDATCFRNFDIGVIQREAAKYGYTCNGDEILYDGVTGKQLRCMVFFGVAFYQKLKHMVIDKIHSRAKGPRTTLTRQPVEGKAAGGGLRIGVMEQNVLSAIGAAYMVRDRLMEQSDEFKMYVCDVCGQPAHVEKEGIVKECRVCGSNQIIRIKIPYGSKLITQELAGMGIATRITSNTF
jgi:DNA-directed RNA polymerase beta subunit